MLKNKKIALSLSIWCFFGILLFPLIVYAIDFPPFPETMERVGDDNTVTDQTEDLFIIGSNRYTSVSIVLPWLDLKNITFAETGSNYSISVGLNGIFNASADMRISISLDINNSGTTPDSPYLFLSLSPSQNKVRCQGIITYEQYNIHTINGKIITWTFPKLNVTNIVINNESIPEWKVFIFSYGDFLGGNYFDFMGVSRGSIPAYPLIILAIISITSILFISKKIKKS